MGLKENIKNKRTEHGMTLEELAKKVGVSRQTIQRYESGVISNIPSDKIELIAKALDTTPAYLMGWEELNDNDIADVFQTDMEQGMLEKMRTVFSKQEVAHFEDYIRLSSYNMKLVDKYTGKLLSLQQMEYELNAAHDAGATSIEKENADSIMMDDSEWE